jgi:hypothetical protein
MTVSWLADECGTTEDFLWTLAKNSTLMYQPTRKEPKKGGRGFREIDPPKQQYKRVLRRITKVLSSNIKHHPAAHGGVPGRSSFTSARPHCGAKFIVTRDVKDCYPSISPGQLFKAFRLLGASPAFAKFLSALMTVHQHIPQGGPPSSLALNLYFFRMDDHFYRRSRSQESNYGRLADDFVISTNSRKKAIALESELDHAIKHRRLEINEKKREKKGLLAGDQLKEIHSLVVNSRRGLKPKTEHIKKGLELATHYARCCRCAKLTDLAYLADLRQKVTGMMYYFRQADFSPARHIRMVLEHADKKVLRMLLKKGLQPHKNKWWLVHATRNEPQRLMHLWESKTQLRSTA